MIEKIKEIVKRNPNNIAYKINNERITYKELWNKATYYSEYLINQGVDPVIIYGHKSISILISILSCIISNRTYIPIETSMPLYRLKKIIKSTNASLILTENKINLDNISIHNLNELEKYKIHKDKNNNNNIVYIIFTSGSSGEAKGVPISKDNLNNFINWISNLKPLCDYKNINVLNQANFNFDLSVADLYYSLCNGHTLISFNRDNSEEIFDVMKEINVAVMTPTFMKYCLLNEEFNEKNYKKFKCVYFCGEQLEKKLVNKLFLHFPNLKIINAYGPTEATSAVSAIRITKDMLINEKKLLPVGETQTFATNIEIIDNEIVLKGKSVFNGYLNNYTQGYYKENNINCYKTGDIGYIENNKLYCIGRKDNQIKYKGYRIELEDIEYNINLIDEVEDCAVIAKYNENNIVKTIVAYVVLKKDIDIKMKLKKYLPDYMIPKTIKIIDKLPVNKNGKIDRRELSKYE